jgi:tetratricopeptide (TPR) repeat protein
LKEINSGKKLFIIQHSFDGPSVKDIPQVFPQIPGFPGKVICADTDLLIRVLWEKVLDTPYDDSLNYNCKLALKNWELIIDNLKEVLLKDDSYRIYTLGYLFQEIQQTKTASKYYKLLKDSKYSDLYTGKALIGLCNVYRTEGKVGSILRPAEKALQISMRLGDNIGKIASHTHLGIYHKRLAIDYIKVEEDIKKASEQFNIAIGHHKPRIMN